MATTMMAIQVPRAGADFAQVRREIPEPGAGTVRIRIEACGVCRGDAVVKEGHWPGLTFPRVPGHEVAGVIDAVGPGVTGWSPGQRVGVGWYGDHCGDCDPCRQGDFMNCRSLRVTGISHDGGYAQFMIAPARGLARIPEALSAAEAAPILCAGVTTFNALRHSGAGPGELVAIQGVGGLGHLAVQFAHRLGFHVVALSRGGDKEALAHRLGAHQYLDTEAVDAAEALTRLGGARVILATAPNSRSIAGLFDGLGPNGKLVVVAGAADPIQVSPLQLIRGRRSLQGWASGTTRDSEDALAFCALTGIRPMIETYPLAQAAQAYDRMLTNQVRFRAVLTE